MKQGRVSESFLRGILCAVLSWGDKTGALSVSVSAAS